MIDELVWQPSKGTFYRFRDVGGGDRFQADWLGRFFSPLILLRQATISPSFRTVQPDGTKSSQRPLLPPRDKLRPELQRGLPEFERDYGVSWEQLARGEIPSHLQ
jgi:hypothetical protein